MIENKSVKRYYASPAIWGNIIFENKFELSNDRLAYNLLLSAGFIKSRNPMFLPPHINYIEMDESFLVVLDANIKFMFNYGPNVEETIISLLVNHAGIKQSIHLIMVYDTELVDFLFIMKDSKYIKSTEKSYDLSNDSFHAILSLIGTI